MLSDRELLELAAKAAGYDYGEINGVPRARIEQDFGTCGTYGCQNHQWRDWNPLTDDGDALRLAVRLLINVDRCPDDVGRYVRAWRPGTEMIAAPVSVVEEFEAKGDPCVATRRAIVRAAAELQRAKDK